MADLIDIGPYLDRQRPKKPPPFDALVQTMQRTPLLVLIEAIVAARDVHELTGIVEDLTGVIIHCTTRPRQD
jgi:hypothetical protein